MKLSENIKPISYLKSHAAEIIRDFGSGGKHTMIVTQNGEAKAVLLDIQTYDKLQESLTMLKLLAQSNASLQQGKVTPAKNVFANLRKKIQDDE